MDAMSIDMDPSAAPGNTATSIGSVQTCARVNENNALDADEDSVDTLQIDVTALNIPASNPAIGYTYAFGFPSASVLVSAENQLFLLNSLAGSSLVAGLSDAVPDSDGTFNTTAVDGGPNPASAESGSGVLGRIGIQSIPAAVTGVFPLTLTGNAHVDTGGIGRAPDVTNNAQVAVNTPCAAPADLKVTGVTVVSPASATAGAPFTVSGTVMVHDNGPGPSGVVGNGSATLSAPADCTISTANPVVTLTVLAVSVSLTFPVSWTVTCSEPSNHGFTINGAVALNPLFGSYFDPNLANNAGSSAASVTAVTADADLNLVSQTITFPASINVDESVLLTVDKVIHNNGPQDFVQATITKTFNLPADCTLNGLPNTGPYIITATTGSLAISAAVPYQENDFVLCTLPGVHQITVENCVSPLNAHVADPTPGNNCQPPVPPVTTVPFNVTLAQIPFFSLRPDNPSGCDPADIYLPPSIFIGPPAVPAAPLCGLVPVSAGIPCAGLGLVCGAPGSGGPPVQDDVADFSFGVEATAGSRVFFSTDSGSSGVPGSAMQAHSNAAVACHEEGDEYAEAPGGPFSTTLVPAILLGLRETPCPDLANDDDDVDGLAWGPPPIFPAPPPPPYPAVYYSLSPGSPTLAALGGSSADILYSPLPGPGAPAVFRSAESLGLVPGDVIDGLCVFDPGPRIAARAPLVAPRNSAIPGPGSILFSLVPGSPSLALISATAGDLLLPAPPAPFPTRPYVFKLGTTYGLLGGDNLDAAKCQEPNPPFSIRKSIAASSVMLRDACPGGTASFEIRETFAPFGVIRAGAMAEAPPGTFGATFTPIGPPRQRTTLTITVACPNPASNETIVETFHTFTLYYDPSGDVRTVAGYPIEDAAVTLFRFDVGLGTFVQVPDGDPGMSPGNRANPSLTDINGHFGWDVIDGSYRVRAAHPGCVSPSNPAQTFVETGDLAVPPPVTGLDLRLSCPDADGDRVPDAVDNCANAFTLGQENLDGDALGDACDPDDDNDGVGDAAETACGSDPMDVTAPLSRPERIDYPFTGLDDDGDAAIDEALPVGAANFDCDGDGYNGGPESGTPLCGNGANDDDKVHLVYPGPLVADDGVVDDGCPGGPAQAGLFSEAAYSIGLGDQDPCGTNGWPNDFVSGGIPDSTNKINVLDLTSFLAPARHLDTAPGNPLFDKRWDLIPGRGFFNNIVNVTDLTSLIAGTSGFPPMLGGAKAFNGPACPWTDPIGDPD